MEKGLIRPLVEGPVDVIGDVHGELGALEALLDRLGYDPHGHHKQGRRLVFVGDLCDRGEDSPAVIRRVRTLVEDGRAQAVAGNHELNLLRGEHKHGNHWFFGERDHPEFGPSAVIGASEQREFLDFFRSLPVALERSDLRVVHAAWLDPQIDRLRSVRETIDVAYAMFDERLQRDPALRELKARRDEERARLGAALTVRHRVPEARYIGRYDEACQMGNPVRIATSGVERATDRPFYALGRWRHVERVAWWHAYEHPVPVLFGHYWRWWDPDIHHTLSKGEPHLFADDPVGPFMADDHRAFCIDFSVGSRFKQRLQGHAGPFHGRLAAIRWPERELVFDAPG